MHLNFLMNIKNEMVLYIDCYWISGLKVTSLEDALEEYRMACQLKQRYPDWIAGIKLNFYICLKIIINHIYLMEKVSIWWVTKMVGLASKTLPLLLPSVPIALSHYHHPLLYLGYSMRGKLLNPDEMPILTCTMH